MYSECTMVLSWLLSSEWEKTVWLLQRQNCCQHYKLLYNLFFETSLILILLLLILNLEHLWTVTYMFCSSYCRGNEFISFRLWLRLLSCSVFHAFIFVIANHVCLGKIVSVKNIGISFVGKLIPWNNLKICGLWFIQTGVLCITSHNFFCVVAR